MSGATKLIYGLVDPRTHLVRYVGQSSRGLHRPREHRSLGRRTGPHCKRWIAQLQQLGLDYEVVLLETGDLDLNIAERWWIAYGRASGWPLTNLTDGGEGASGYQHTDESRARISRARIGIRFSEETRKRIAEANLRPEIRDRIVARMTGQNNPMSNARRIAPAPTTRADVKQKISDTLRGHEVSDATRKKISDSLKRYNGERRN